MNLLILYMLFVLSLVLAYPFGLLLAEALAVEKERTFQQVFVLTVAILWVTFLFLLLQQAPGQLPHP